MLTYVLSWEDRLFDKTFVSGIGERAKIASSEPDFLCFVLGAFLPVGKRFQDSLEEGSTAAKNVNQNRKEFLLQICMLERSAKIFARVSFSIAQLTRAKKDK